MDKIKTGSLYEVAEVFRDLSLLKLSKDLSFGERKLYDTRPGTAGQGAFHGRQNRRKKPF